MDNIDSNPQVENSLNISEVKDFLLETSKWGKFLVIVGYVGMGIMVLLGLFVMIGFSSISKLPTPMPFPMGLMGLIYIILAAIYYFPVDFLYKFSVQIKKGINSDDQQSINSGFENLKSLFKFMGIFTIVILSIYAMVLVLVLPLTMLFFNR